MGFTSEDLDIMNKGIASARHDDLLSRFNDYISQGDVKPDEAEIPTAADLPKKAINPQDVRSSPRLPFNERLSASDLGFLSRNPDSKKLYDSVQSQGLLDSLERGDTNKFFQQGVLSGIPASQLIEQADSHYAGKTTSSFLQGSVDKETREDAQLRLNKLLQGKSATQQQKIISGTSDQIKGLRTRKEAEQEETDDEVAAFINVTRLGNGGKGMSSNDMEILKARNLIELPNIKKGTLTGWNTEIDRKRKEENEEKRFERTQRALEKSNGIQDRLFYQSIIKGIKEDMSALKDRRSNIRIQDRTDVDVSALSNARNTMSAIEKKENATTKEEKAELMNENEVYRKAYSEVKALLSKEQMSDENHLMVRNIDHQLNALSNDLTEATRNLSDFLGGKTGKVKPPQKKTGSKMVAPVGVMP